MNGANLQPDRFNSSRLDSDTESINSQSSYPVGSAGYAYNPQSKRSRLINLVRTTRDTYIPTIKGSISQLASDASSRAFSYEANTYNTDGSMRLPADTTITLYPSYSRQLPNGDYATDVRAWLSCPGAMNRKNRIMLTLVRQLIKGGQYTETNQVIDQLENDNLSPDIFQPGNLKRSDSSSDVSLADSTVTNSQALNHQESISSSVSSTSVLSAKTEDTVRERMSSFIARSIPNVPVEVSIGSSNPLDSNKIKRVKIITDTMGRFDTSIITNYEPSLIHATLSGDETIFAIQEAIKVPSDGVSIITDIDDTIKLTGVIGDKRELLRSLLTKEVSEWTIPGISAWFSHMGNNGVHFHYVSNSPWQLFSTISKYLSNLELPMGSVHLKQYSGNLITSLLEPSRDRKKPVLEKILKDFPNRQFICVGDSGEQDLEAYVDLAARFPAQVLAIYIRVVPDSLSDVDDARVLKDIKKILTKRGQAVSRQSRSRSRSPMPPQPANDFNLIDLSSDFEDSQTEQVKESTSPVKKKPPPKVPKKPMGLKGKQVEKSTEQASEDSFTISDQTLAPGSVKDDESYKPALPPRTYREVVPTLSVSTPPPPPPPRRYISSAENLPDDPYVLQSTQDDYGYLSRNIDTGRDDYFDYYDGYDRKGSMWIKRIHDDIRILPSNVELKLWTNAKEALEDSINSLSTIFK